MPLNKKNIKANISANINNIILTIFFTIIELTLVASIVVLFYLNRPLSSTKVLFIPKGSTSSIVTYLNKKGYELNPLDKLVIKSLGYPQSGWIDLKTNYMTKADFLYKLTKSKAALKTVTLIPGETSYFFLKDVAKKFNLSFDKLNEIYKKHAFKADGNILAETYKLPYGMKEDHLLFYLFSQTNKKYEAFSKKIFGEYNQKNWYKYIVIASIIQKESASVDEMTTVSSVVHNRLKLKMPLQMDGTLNYGKYSHTKVTPAMIKNDTSSYNTYKNRGLPEHPVCAVSLDAIKAAIFPKLTDYLYFVKDVKTGKHRFSKTYKAHNQNVNVYRAQKKALKKQAKIKGKPKAKEPSVFPKKPEEKKTKSIKSLWNTVQ